MKLKGRLFLFFIIILIVGFISLDVGLEVLGIKQEEVINFTDGNLEQIIRKELQKDSGAITISEVKNIRKLDASDSSIVSIEGIKYLTNLTELNLSRNKIEDIDELKYML